MNKQEFYEAVDDILHTDYQYKDVWINNRKSGRWGPREPGNGRFKGFGLVRWFGQDTVLISLYHPYQVNHRCEDREALIYLSKLIDTYRMSSIDVMFDKFRAENNGFGWS